MYNRYSLLNLLLAITTFGFLFTSYVYKRLRFLNNKQISQGVALLFLAAWHGFNSGYFMCFFLEFVFMNGEKQVTVKP